MLWTAIHLPHLALDGVLRRHPAPDAPLALVGGSAQRRVLVDVNAAARAAGLRPGQGLVAAQAVLPGAALVAHVPEEARGLLDLLAAWAYGYSSMVSLAGEDMLLLEVGASMGLFGPWPRFERRLRRDLAALGFRHALAVAPAPLAACALATAEDGLVVHTPEQQERALARLAVEQARLPAELVAAARAMGLRSLRQLFALPPAALARRFGPELVDQLDRLRGRSPDPRPLYRPPDRFEARVELAFETDNHQALLFPLRRLVTDLAAYLAGRDGGVQRYVLRLEHEGGAASEVRVGLLAPERDGNRLFELARGRLERSEVLAPVQGLGLLAEELPPFVPARADLFDTRPGEGLPFEALRERLRARLGEDAVHQLDRDGDPRPERAQRRRPLLPTEPRLGEHRPRPAWLLPRPVPLREGVTEVLAGPERIESGWWDGGDARRDYYVVRTGRGQRAWVYCPAGERGPYMLHGWFA